MLGLGKSGGGTMTLDAIGLGRPDSWPVTVALALGGLALMVACSPLADRLATRWFAAPPTLGAFRALRQSRAKLLLGILAAWLLGGLLEEIVLRGILLRAVEWHLAPRLGAPVAAAIAIATAALAAGLVHLYQGARAAAIVTQLSILLGLLFVAGGRNLWTVVLCHGLYDTVAFVRFARKQSRYSDLDAAARPDSEARATTDR